MLREEVSQQLDLVEELLRDAVQGEDEFVTAAARHLADAGGKRFRPLLTVLAAHLGQPDAPEVSIAAVVVELTHLATLYHDDVMDEATRRRGTDSANARWDNSVAILAGDYLFARASDLVAGLGPEAVRIQARTFQRLVTGQIRETIGSADGEDPVKHHLGVLADKTGSLIATAGRFGAMFGGCNPEVISTMKSFGEQIGVAFQLADDLVDIGDQPGVTGKTPGTDLREGVLTMPALLVLRSDQPGDERLRELLSRPIPDDEEHAEALELLRAHAAVAQARDIARGWADDARRTLEPLPSGPVRQALVDLCDYVVTRSG